MSIAGATRSTVSPTLDVDEESGAERVVAVYDCTRIGLVANPPGLSFSDLFRFRRFRR